VNGSDGSCVALVSRKATHRPLSRRT
jgi:hypothetical protein